jgi:hypothetical protein
MSLFRLELESYTATAFISIPAFASYYLNRGNSQWHDR